MFNGLFGIGRAYRKLPPHHNFAELADNIEKFAHHLKDRCLGSFGNERAILKAPDRWEWKLGADLITLIEYARHFVPPGSDSLHHYGRE